MMRLDALTLCDPVMIPVEAAQEESVQNLLGPGDAAFRGMDFCEEQLIDDVSLTFVLHPWEEEVLSVENPLLVVPALRRHGILVELHGLARGTQGLSQSGAKGVGSKVEGFVWPEGTVWMGKAVRGLRRW